MRRAPDVRGRSGGAVRALRDEGRRALAWALGLAAVIAVSQVAVSSGVAVQRLLTDPVQAEGDSVFRGAGSSIFLLVWGVAGGMLLLAGAVRRGTERRFLVASAGLLLALGIDDAALLHEEAADQLLGVQDTVVYAFYAAMALIWLVSFRRQVLRTDVVPLVAAGVAFAVSNVVDVIESFPYRAGVEEPAKYFGVVAIAVWALRTARDAVSEPVPDEGERVPTPV